MYDCHYGSGISLVHATTDGYSTLRTKRSASEWDCVISLRVEQVPLGSALARSLSLSLDQVMAHIHWHDDDRGDTMANCIEIENSNLPTRDIHTHTHQYSSSQSLRPTSIARISLLEPARHFHVDRQ